MNNRYLGRVALVFAGSLMVKLANGKRASVPAHELTASGLEFSPGDEISVGLFTRPDGSLVAIDPARC